MEGNPADLTAYKDDGAGYNLRDHTYYGNGCPGGDTNTTPCSTRIVETSDNEPQKNGTYYHFQAATVGTGGSLETPNDSSPDTFCPLGWQLPYSGTGGDYYDKSKSWKYLLDSYGITYNEGTEAGATKVRSFPFSYTVPGYFQWYSGSLQYQNSAGYYWASTVLHEKNAYALAMWGSVIRVFNTNGKAYGFTVRCIDYFRNLPSTARWQEILQI